MSQSTEFRLHITGPDFEREWPLPLGTTLVGREFPEEGLLLPDDTRMVSRRHAALRCTPVECVIKDLGSINGTWVNEKPLPEGNEVRLSEGDIIRIGPFELAFRRIPVPTAEVIPPGVPPPVSPALPPTKKGKGIPPELVFDGHTLLKYLPVVYHTEFMAQFLALFEAFLLPIKWTVDNFDLFLDPRTAPVSFLPWLAQWLDIVFDPSWEERQRRQLLSEAGQIYARLGTLWALSRVLEIYTGHKPEIIDDERMKPFTFVVKLPVPESDTSREHIEALIDAYKPVYTSYTLEFTQ
ncbi:MAG: phage tail protein I [Anaerolineae bacterium]|nr:phage tail protein I [Anaerolineae bacterium]